MWKIIAENYELFIATTTIIIEVIGGILLLLIRRRLKKAVPVQSEVFKHIGELEEKLRKLASYGEIFLSVPALIKEAEEIFTTPKSGVLKLGYVIQQVQKRFDLAHIKASASEFTDYIESILAAPEKKGEQ